MKKIAVYDPPMCCSTGVCGPEVDPVLPRIAGMLAQLEGAGVTVERYNLTQQPMAFVQNADVRAILDQEGTEALPLFFVDGECVCQGHYPDAGERAQLIKRAGGKEV
ncbi:MAG: arsenite efflux transporter metallochaperone ArsD [Opitutales bacterium]|nr:arsenite efflux transporter metallochaperone ArsD [Opitutales bacterium]MCH8540694.1 arsenite efflux transporter metallochaperone ArsD [Opitutales bacterium]